MAQRVWLVEVPGGEFRETERPVPALGQNEVLVRISASGVNPLDTKIRAAKAAHAKQPLPAVLGLDMAGTVEQVGSSVSGFARGDEVFGMVGGVGGLQGTLAEYVAADAALLAHKPKNLSMREAAALPLSILTAWEGLVDRANVHANQTVLIHAGAGGVGYVATQIARAFGGAGLCYGFAGQREGRGGRSVLRRLITRTTSVEEYVASATNGRGFDIVYDTVGGATLDASFGAVKRYTGHVLSSLGWGSHSLAPLSFRGATYSGVFTLLPLITGEGRAHHGEILARAAALAEAGKLKPLLNERRFSTGEIGEAHDLVEAGALGKVVVEI